MKKILTGGLAFALMCNLSVINVEALSGLDNHNVNSIGILSPEEKITEELYSAMESSSNRIPVCIWYSDIDYMNVEKRIDEKTGLHSDELEEEYDSVSSELIELLSVSDNNEGNENLKIMMKEHMDKTANQRKKEKEKTEIYLKARKEIIKEEYTECGKNISEKINLTGGEVGYISVFTPTVFAELTSEEIVELSKESEIEEIDLCEFDEPVMNSLDSGNQIKSVMGISKINEYLALSGEGVNIGIFDWHNIEGADCSNYDLDYSKVNNVGNISIESHSGNNNDTHGAYCASIAAGEYGVSPDSLIYVASSAPYDSIFYGNTNFDVIENLETLANVDNLSLISISLSYSRSRFSNVFYSQFEKYIDKLICDTKTTIIIASGNNSQSVIGSPGLSYNAITVNGFHLDNNGNNVLDDYSYMNSSGCLKPDVIACSLNNGTSTATPVIAGMVALLYQYRPSLQNDPAAVKAIVLASCHEKIGTSESLNSGLTERQGAGIPNMYSMLSIVAQHSYGSGIIDINNNDIRIVQPPYGANNINVSMSFLQKGTSNIADLDLKLYKNSISSNNQIGASINSNSSSELIYHGISQENNYIIRISNYTSSLTNISYGYAWSTDNNIFIPTEENEGLFSFKNKHSNMYMNYNSTSASLYQSPYSGNLTQQWVVKKVGSYYKIQNASTHGRQIILDNTTSNPYSAITSISTSSANIKIIKNSDGTISFVRNLSSTQYALTVYGNSTLSNAQLVWSVYSSSNNSQKWSMELVGYKKGDVDRNGILNNSDVETIIDIYNYIRSNTAHTYDDMQMYLADFDGNGTINSLDAAYLSELIGV